MGKKRIAIISSNYYFMEDLIIRMKEDYEIRRLDGSRLSEMTELMKWSDLSWFEWCDDFIIRGSRFPKFTKIICRLHKYEIFTDMPNQVNWGNVNHLVLVSRAVSEIINSLSIKIDVPCSVIENGLDFSKYTIPPDKKYGKKIAYMGHIKQAKGVQLLLQCFKAIYDYDNDYTFHIAGIHDDKMIEFYYNHMIKEMGIPVSFEGWVKDIPSWFADKDYIICSSISEAFMYSIMEGIACGLMPLVHNFPGADSIYPESCLYNSVSECIDLLMDYEILIGVSNPLEESVDLREHMKRRFSIEKQYIEIKKLLDQYLED